MKALHGESTATVLAPLDECVALLSAVDRYPSWYPEVVREVVVVEVGHDGRPIRVQVTLHMAHGPIVKDFHLLTAISVEEAPATVKLIRIPSESSDDEEFAVIWRLEDRGNTHIHLQLDASLSVPRFLPLGGIATAFADGFMGAATRALAPEPSR